MSGCSIKGAFLQIHKQAFKYVLDELKIIFPYTGDEIDSILEILG